LVTDIYAKYCNATFKYKDVKTNKFQRFLDRISAETFLKCIILVIIQKNRHGLGAPPSNLLPPAAGALAPDPHQYSMARNMQDPTHIEHFWLLQIADAW